MALVSRVKALAKSTMKQRLPPPVKANTGLPWILLVLAVLTALPELVLQLTDRGILPFPNLRLYLFAFGSLQPGLGEGIGPLFDLHPISMFVTYGFLHTGPVHLAINIAGLIWLGRLILSYRTSETFIVFYLFAMVGAAELFVLIGPEGASTVGASGALFGLLGIYVTDAGLFASANPRTKEAWIQFLRLLLTTLALGFADFATQSFTGSPTAWQAHTGGFLTGALIALLAPPRYRQPS